MGRDIDPRSAAERSTKYDEQTFLLWDLVDEELRERIESFNHSGQSDPSRELKKQVEQAREYARNSSDFRNIMQGAEPDRDIANFIEQLDEYFRKTKKAREKELNEVLEGAAEDMEEVNELMDEVSDFL